MRVHHAPRASTQEQVRLPRAACACASPRVQDCIMCRTYITTQPCAHVMLYMERIYTHMYMHTYMHAIHVKVACMRLYYSYTYMHTYMICILHMDMPFMHVALHACMSYAHVTRAHSCVHVCVCVCAQSQTGSVRERDREREREREDQTEEQQSESHTHTHTYIHT